MKKLITLVMILMMACCAVAMSGCSGDKYAGKWIAVYHAGDNGWGTLIGAFSDAKNFKDLPVGISVVTLGKNGDGYIVEKQVLKGWEPEIIKKNEAEHLKSVDATKPKYNGMIMNMKILHGAARTSLQAAPDVVLLHCDVNYTWKTTPVPNNNTVSVNGNDLKFSNGEIWTYIEKDKTLRRGNIIFYRYSESDEKKMVESMKNAIKDIYKEVNKTRQDRLNSYKAKAAEALTKIQAGNRRGYDSAVFLMNQGATFQNQTFIDNMTFKD